MDSAQEEEKKETEMQIETKEAILGWASATLMTIGFVTLAILIGLHI